MHQYELYNALRAMKQLQNAHKTFLEVLAVQPEVESDLGTLKSTGEGVSLQCLGYDISMRQRPIALQDNRLVYEYEFLAEYWGEKHMFMRLYMNTQGVLFRDAGLGDYLGDAGSRQICGVLIAETFAQLLQSKVLTPS